MDEGWMDGWICSKELPGSTEVRWWMLWWEGGAEPDPQAPLRAGGSQPHTTLRASSQKLWCLESSPRALPLMWLCYQGLLSLVFRV